MHFKSSTRNRIFAVIILLVLSLMISDAVVIYQMQSTSAEINFEKIDINTCTQEELEEIPGIGPKKATLIIQNRPYTDLKEVLELNGIGEKTYESLVERTDID